MNYDTWKSTEPIDPEERDVERQDQVIREQRWAEFVDELRARRQNHNSWTRNMEDMVKAYWMANRNSGSDPDELDSEQRTYWDFAESEGWDGVLVAMARAMKEQRAEAAEIERRR